MFHGPWCFVGPDVLLALVIGPGVSYILTFYTIISIDIGYRLWCFMGPGVLYILIFYTIISLDIGYRLWCFVGPGVL